MSSNILKLLTRPKLKLCTHPFITTTQLLTLFVKTHRNRGGSRADIEGSTVVRFLERLNYFTDFDILLFCDFEGLFPQVVINVSMVIILTRVNTRDPMKRVMLTKDICQIFSRAARGKNIRAIFLISTTKAQTIENLPTDHKLSA